MPLSTKKQLHMEQRKKKVYRANTQNTANTDKTPETLPNNPIPAEAMEQLIRVMNDSPTIAKLNGTAWEIHALKPGTQWLIAEETCKIAAGENLSMGDVIKRFAVNLPAICRVLTLALLNDKQRINSNEYQEVYDTLLWGDYQLKDWATLLMEAINLIDIDFFFATTNAVQTVKTILQRKTTAAERELYRLAPNTAK